MSIRPDFIPLTVSWNLTRRCSLACAHCYIDASARLKADEESTTRQCRDILRQLAGVNPEALLILTGGEPLIREDIFDLIAEATELGFWTVLGSHGGLLDGRKAERLAKAGLKGAGLSLESASPAHHDRFRGVAGAWKKTMQAVEELQGRNLPFLFEMTLTRGNRDQLGSMAELAVKRGATALNIFFLVHTGRGAKLNDLNPREYETALVEIAALQREYAGRLMLNAKCAPHYRRVLWEADPSSVFLRTFHGGGCPAGTYYCRIGPTGDLTPCPYMPLSVGNLHQTPFEKLWREAPELRRLREEKKGGRCGDCEFSQLCGGCRCRAYAATGDTLAEDPSCAYEPGKHGGRTVSLPPEAVYGVESEKGLNWTPEAEAAMKKIPAFARGMVRRAVENAAKKKGLGVVTEEWLKELKKKMAGRLPAPAPILRTGTVRRRS